MIASHVRASFATKEARLTSGQVHRTGEHEGLAFHRAWESTSFPQVALCTPFFFTPAQTPFFPHRPSVTSTYAPVGPAVLARQRNRMSSTRVAGRAKLSTSVVVPISRTLRPVHLRESVGEEEGWGHGG